MGIIQVMDKALANKIAAGEVVERPASVVKELTENALDAGAASVTVEIQKGGTSFIRVTDNGKGMAPEDVKKAFLPHATSKIYTYEDLEHIATLGFRGEALASIAAVSRTELLTKPIGSLEGSRLVLEGGQEVAFESVGCPEGTTVIVRDLFFNTPARMKFLKKDASEAALVSDILEKEAFAHPEVSFRLLNGGKEAFFTPGNNDLLSVVHALFGKDYAKEMIPVDYTANGITVSGLIGKSILTRPNRSRQLFFVNGRPINNKTLSAAIAESYKNQIPVGRFPVCILKLTLSPTEVDVNVHPAKTEVKFADEHGAYDAVYWAVKNALCETSQIPEVKTFTSHKEREVPMPEAPIVPQKPVFEMTPPAKPALAASPTVLHAPDIPHTKAVEDVLFPISPKESYDFAPPAQKAPVQETPKEAPLAQEMPSVPAAEEQILYEEKPTPPTVIGQVFSTYILAACGDILYIYDQHAAHERLQYEALLKSRAAGTVSSQMLLFPISVSLTAAEAALFHENEDFFSSLGFDAEEVGSGNIMIRELPADIASEHVGELFGELLELLSNKRVQKSTETIDRALYSIACKAAIKANHNLTMREMEQLVLDCEALGNTNTCPHGRPYRIQMTKKQLEKEFYRI